jgi:hypothetical protein
MSFVKARPPLTPMEENWARPATPIPKEFSEVLLAVLFRGWTPFCSIA